MNYHLETISVVTNLLRMWLYLPERCEFYDSQPKIRFADTNKCKGNSVTVLALIHISGMGSALLVCDVLGHTDLISVRETKAFSSKEFESALKKKEMKNRIWIVRTKDAIKEKECHALLQTSLEKNVIPFNNLYPSLKIPLVS